MVDQWTDDQGSEDGKMGRKHFCFNGNVDWCVKYKEYFDSYEPPYYYFLDKSNGREFALMHVGSAQLKNIRDEALKAEEFGRISYIVYSILAKIGELPVIDFSESDFKVIIPNMPKELFIKLSDSILPNLLSNAIDQFDPVLLQKLLTDFPPDKLLKGNGRDVTEPSLISDMKWMVKNYSHKFHLFSTDVLDVLFNDFGADEYEVFRSLVGKTKECDSDIVKWLISDGWIDPNVTIRTGRDETTAFALAVTSLCLTAVEEFLKDRTTDVNTQIDSNGGRTGYTPILYLSNMNNYEQEIIYNLLLKDDRTDLNAYREDYYMREWVGQSVLDNALDERKPELIARGALTYKEIPGTNYGKEGPK